ncbi:unnamed protein product [Polarella glacialis]|uniref:Uncharacterized protein n=1 Tax=Polarella glacialis TaxID=89957 RepID=A0A813EMU6_POLGL|nr:unnamed protein product [Polarella glacialis]
MAARDALRPGRPGASSYAALADSDDDAEEDSESGGDEATSPAIQHDGESSGSITGDEDADEDEDGDAAALAAQSGPRRRLEGSDLALYREERGIKVGFHSPSDSRFGAEDFLESRYPILEFEDLGHFGVPHDLVAACCGPVIKAVVLRVVFCSRLFLLLLFVVVVVLRVAVFVVVFVVAVAVHVAVIACVSSGCGLSLVCSRQLTHASKADNSNIINNNNSNNSNNNNKADGVQVDPYSRPRFNPKSGACCSGAKLLLPHRLLPLRLLQPHSMR